MVTSTNDECTQTPVNAFKVFRSATDSCSGSKARETAYDLQASSINLGSALFR